MKKTIKKVVSLLLIFIMVFGSAPLAGFVDLELPEWSDISKLLSFKAEAATYSGTCGDNLTWALDTDTGVLEISGIGAMTNYSSYSNVPWYKYISDIKTIKISNGVTNIGDFAFYTCDNLTNITIPDSVTSIGADAFCFCRNLTSVTIPDSLTSIGADAFWYCENLTNITIPDSVTSIGGYAFCGCKNLTSITIPDSVTNIGADTFLSCTSLTSIIVDSANTAYSSDEYGVLFNKDKTELIQYPIGNSRTSYIIPNNVTNIGDYAFSSCGNLANISIPYSVTNIGNHTFSHCSNLTSITIPDKVSSIGDAAFWNCESLTSITIPNSVTSIGANAFLHCESLTDVYYLGNEEEWAKITIGSYNSCLTNATIHFIKPHIHSHVSIITAATCTTQGYTTYTCNECGDTYIDDYTDALGHSCTSSVTKPTCTEQGYTTYTCTRSGCGYSDMGNYKSATGHSYGDWEEIPATCEKSGSRYKVCSACSDKVTETIPKLEHEYESVVTPSSCVNEGYTTHTCINCGDDYIDSNTPALGHSYGEWTDETVATCETAGLRYRECSCGDREEKTVEPTGHDYVKTSVVTPTHEKDGYSTYVCNNCGNDENRDFVPAEGHSYGEWQIETVATCTEEGLRAKECSCGDRIEETIAALGHKYTKTSVIPSTCTTKGYSIYTCSNCSTTKKDDYVQATGHSYGEFITETYATCAKEGLQYKTCSACSDRIEEVIPKTEHKYESKTTAPTCTEGGYTTHTCSECQDTYTDSTVDALGHSYGEWTTETEATCTNSGLKYQECSLCKDKREEKIPIIEHDYSSSDTEPTCTEKGFTTHTCNVCGYNYNDTYIAALGHAYGEWIIDKEANLLETGSQHRNCTVCNETEKQSIPKVEVDIETNTNYGLAVFTVVHAQELTPISGAQIFISTENDGENTFITDGNGRVSVILPVGKQHISVYAGNCLTRNLNITVKSGTTYFPQIGLSDMPVYDAEIDYHEMTLEEIEAAGIDTSNPDNQHVYKYELKLDFVPGIDTSSIIAYFNGSGIYLGGYSGGKEGESGEPGEPTYTLHYHEYPSKICFTGSCHTVEVEKGRTVSLTYYPESYDDDYTFDGWYEDTALTKEITSVKIEDYNTYVYGHWIHEGEEVDPPKPTQGIKIEEDEEIITVYPVSEYFYLIVRGEVTWLKEMFDVEMLVINRSNTDTLEDVKATLTLPEGLSLASMIGKQQSLEQYIGSVPEGETKSVHWYVKGDKEGSYGLEARLQGMVMPFEEPIDDVFVSKNNIQVYAGNALNLHFEFPSVAYYGEDYPITITLTNVSDKPLYNINHMVQIEQGMQVVYSNGTTKKRIETSEWKSIGVEKFNPGDKIIIEASVNIFFESEMMKAQIEKYIGYVDGIEQLLNGYNAVSTSIKAYEKLIKTFSGNIKSINSFMKTKSLDTDKDKLFAQLHNKLSSLYLSYSKSGSKAFDAIFGLANSGVSAALNVITNDPEAWLDKCAEEDITKLIKKISALESSLSSEESETNSFDIFDSIRTVISAIPVVFTLTNVTMTEDENNTTSIPWSYSVSQASPQYFGVSSVSKYLLSIVQMMLGDVYDKNVPGLMQLLVGVDDPFNTDEALEYIKATEKEITQFKAKDATGKVTFKAWIERNDSGNTVTISDDFNIMSDNDSAKFENGVLTFTGDGMISVQPKNTTGGTLYVEDSEGNVYTYVIDVVEEHECSAGTQQVVIAPTEEYNGFAVKCCETCDEIMKVINLSYANCCMEHNFGDWTTETKATCSADGVETRTCSTCGFVEYEFVAASGHAVDSYEIIKEATCTEVGIITYYCSCGESYTEGIIETGHKFSEWNTEKEATCEEDGLKTAVCAECGATGEEVIPMSGHADEDGDGKCDICIQVPESGEDDEEEPIVLESISLASEPTKKNYYLGEALDTSGLKLRLVYSDGSTETVSSGFSTKGFNSMSSGTKTVTVYYSGLKTSFTVEVNTVSITLSESSKSMFIGGTSEISATVNPEGQTVIWTSSDENIVTVLDGVITAVSEGNVTVTALIVVGGKTYSASCTVVISDPKGVVTSVTVVGESLKTEYYVGDPLNTSGLQLEVTYADGTTEIISSGFATNGFDSSNEGSKMVVVEYGDFTVKYDITVKPAEERKALYSGTCGAEGDNLTWTLYENGQLVIDGIGDMASYRNDAPWESHKDLVCEVVVCDSITSIGDYAFYNCNNLTSVYLGCTLKKIGNSAFRSCEGLISVTIPSSVLQIGDYAFSICESLVNIKVESSNKYYSNDDYGVLFNKSKTQLIQYPLGNSITDYEIPNGVTSISGWAFLSSDNLTKVAIPDSVTSIGARAFYSCDGLTNITIPDSVVGIEEDTFGWCTNLTDINLGYNVTSIGDYAFENCISLTNITIPDSVTSIGYGAFYFCDNLTSVTIGNGVTSIGDYAFYFCESLISITIPDSVTSIGDKAFYTCENLINIMIPTSVTSIGDYAFSSCDSLVSITIPDSVTSIGEDAFEYCDSLTSVTIGNGVTSIGDYTFSSCDSLVSITIPDSVTSIGNSAFFNCFALKDVYFTGSEDEWKTITINSGNDYLENASIHYNYRPLESVSIYTLPNKMTYYINESLDTTGLQLKLHYSDGSTDIISEGFSVTGYSVLKIGDQIVTVSYQGYSDTFTVTSYDRNITLSSKNEKLFVGETTTIIASTTPIDMEVMWSSSNINVATVSDDGVITAKSSGTAIITAELYEVIYNNAYIYDKETCEVVVEEVALASIAVKSNPTKISYYVGDTLNTSGLTLTATYNNDTTKTITSGFTCTPTDLNTVGTQKITVTYGGKTTSFNITVEEVALSDIAIKSNPTKNNYYVGDTLDTSGITLTATYNNGTTKTVSDGFSCTPTMLDTVGTQNITVTYGGETTSFSVTVEDIVLTSIAVKSNPAKTSYYVGDTLDTTGLVLTATYNNGKTETVSEGFTCTPTTLETAGTQIITVSYGVETATFNVTVEDVVISNIAVNSMPDNTSYYVGDLLDTTGLTLTATYNNGTTEIITEGFFCTPTTLSTAGTQKIMITYSGKTTTFDVTVEDVVLKSIALKTIPTKMSYYVGDTLDTSGLTLTAIYNNGKSETISSGFICTPTTFDTVGAEKITVTYGGKATSFDVTVESVVLSNISIKNNPSKTDYYIGDTLDTTGLTLTATYNNGKTEIVSEGFMCTPTDFGMAGIQEITVTYGGKTTTFNVTIEDVVLSSIAVKSMPINTSYYVGDSFDTTGLTLTATYNNGATAIISEGFICSPTTFSTSGAQKITIIYDDKITILDVTVEDVVLTGIAVKTNPSKTSYFVGDTLDTTGLVLIATYNNGATKTVSGGFTCTPEMLETAGTQEITVTYGDKSTSFNVDVRAVEISGISISSVPETLNYFVGDTLSTEGLAILVTYNNGTTKTVTSGFTCTPTVLETEGTQKITVTYGEKTTSFNVSVTSVKVTELEIVTVPEKTSYKVGDKFDPTGLTMNAVNNNGEEIVVSEGFVCTPEILDKAGTQVVTVSYGGKSVMITVIVAEAEPETYVVKFISNGEVISETTYIEGEIIVGPKVSETIGYTFTGWTPQIPDAMPAENLTFTAIWIANSYEAVFDANGGVWSGGATEKTVSTEYGADIIAPEAPARDGYVFSGWSPEIGIMDSIDGKTFTAEWIPATDTRYTVETYTMNTSGEYEKTSQTFSGATGESVDAEYIVPIGFTLNAEKSVLEGTIAADNSLVLKVYVDRNTYTFTTVVDGVSTPTAYLYGSMVSEPVTPSKTDYKFIKWNGIIPETMPAENVTITAVFEKCYVCPDCGNEILGEDAIGEHIATEEKAKIKATIKIKNNNGSKTINYGETLKLTAIVTDKPADAKIYWYVDGAKKGEGETFNVSFESGTKTIEVKLVDSNGNAIKNISGNEISDFESVTVKGGFFQKIISFFKNLFGMNRIVVQSIFKDTF